MKKSLEKSINDVPIKKIRIFKKNQKQKIKYLPYSLIDGFTDIQLDLISTSAFIKNIVIDSRLCEFYNKTKKNIDNNSLVLLFGTTRLLIILIHELLGHLLKGKINKLTYNEIKNFIESKRTKYNKKEGGLFIEYKMFGKMRKIFTYSQCIYLLNSNSYNKSSNDFLDTFKKINNKKNFYDDINSNLISFLESLDLDQKKIEFLHNKKISPGVALRTTSFTELLNIPFSFSFKCKVAPSFI